VLAEQFQRLRGRFPDLFLVLVPRHFERSKEIGKELTALGLKFVFRSEITESTRFQAGDVDCLLVNSTGELKLFYEQATVIFVGKSLTASGGQNPIEPAALGKAMVFGPRMDNFADVVGTFLAREAAIQVKDAEHLEAALAELFGDSARREQLGRNALAVYQENRGGIERTVDLIVEHLSGGDLYVTPKKTV